MLVQRELERMILAGDLAAGAKLNEATIADMLGVSRGPVREAFRSLEESGLVRLEKNRGVFVRQVEPRGSRRDLRIARGARRIRRPARRADAPPPPTCATCARWSSAWTRRPRATNSTPTTAPTCNSTTGWSNSPATPSCSRPTAGWSTSCTSTAAPAWRRPARCPSRTREHHDIVEKIAAGQAAAAGRALYDHVMGSRERMHRAHDAQRRAAASLRAPRRGDADDDRSRVTRHRQRPHLPLARSAAGRRLRRRLRARLHHAGHLRRPRAVPGLAAPSAAPASPPTASCRRSPIPTTCRS